TGNSSIKQLGFGTIQNSIALKPGIADFINFPVFWDHSKQHSSKTILVNTTAMQLFWDHSKQHSSKTS
ncbi:hypothetical protein, partial [Streptococcus pyogenes]